MLRIGSAQKVILFRSQYYRRTSKQSFANTKQVLNRVGTENTFFKDLCLPIIGFGGNTEWGGGKNNAGQKYFI